MPKPDLTWDDPEFDDAFENFVGRLDKLSAFRENFSGERPKWMVLSITGEGGVGKSTLLKQFMRLAQGGEIDANLVYCDDKNMTPVEVMGFVAGELARLKIKHGPFDERLAKYRQLREDAEKDPNIPTGFFDLGAQVVTDIAMDAVSHVPGLGLMGREGFKQSAGLAVADAGKYLLSRWSNREEVQLLREPEKTLTPLFLDLLNNAAEEARLVVMLDVFERTGRLLSPWLLDILAAPYKYGKLSAWVSFVVSGRDALSQRWTELGKRVARLALEPFEPNETREYLLNRGITDETLIEQIHQDTGGLPVLVELLGATNPQPGQPLPDISGDAVDRFLQWTPAEMRPVALLAAIPRQFNKDILAALLEEDAHAKFDWLADQSYIRCDTERGWFYHEKVRALMLRHQRNLSPRALDAQHKRLADYFAEQQKEMALATREAYKNQTWRRCEAERFYHFFSAAPEKHWPQTVQAFILAFQNRWRFAARLSNLARQALEETHYSALEAQVGWLETLVAAYEKDEHERVLQQLNRLETLACQEKEPASAFYARRGEDYRMLEKHTEALRDFDRALELDEKHAWAIASRGVTYLQMGKYAEALLDFDRAIQLDEKYAWAIAGRGRTYLQMGKYAEALADFDRAIQLDDKMDWAIASRGQTYRKINQLQNALYDFDRALEIDKNYEWARESRCDVYIEQGDYPSARNDILRLLESNPTDVNGYAKYLMVVQREKGDEVIEAAWKELDSLLELGAEKFKQNCSAPDAKIRAVKAIAARLEIPLQIETGIQKAIDGIIDQTLICLEKEDDAHRKFLLLGISMQAFLTAFTEGKFTLSQTYINFIRNNLNEVNAQKYMFSWANYLPDDFLNKLHNQYGDYSDKEQQLRIIVWYQIYLWVSRDYKIIIYLLETLISLQEIFSRKKTKKQNEDVQFLFDKKILSELLHVINSIDDNVLINASTLLEKFSNSQVHEVYNLINDLRLIKSAKKQSKNRLIALVFTMYGDYFRQIKDKDYETVLVLVNKAIVFDKKYTWAIAIRGKIYRQMGKYAEALLNFDRAIQLDEKYAWAIASRGETYYQMGKYSEALADFDHAIELDEKYAWAIAKRGETYCLMEKYEQALADFDRAIELDEKYAWAIVSRGLTYRQMGKYAEALLDFDRAIQLDEKDAWAIRHRGITHRYLKNYDRALDDINQAILLSPEDYSYYYSRAEVYRLVGKYPEAIIDFTESLKDNEPDIATYVHRAAAYFAIGENNHGLDDLEKALLLECKEDGDHYGRGVAFVLKNDFAQALQELEISFKDLSYRIEALTDDLLDPIRPLPEFQALLAKYDTPAVDQ